MPASVTLSKLPAVHRALLSCMLHHRLRFLISYFNAQQVQPLLPSPAGKYSAFFRTRLYQKKERPGSGRSKYNMCLSVNYFSIVMLSTPFSSNSAIYSSIRLSSSCISSGFRFSESMSLRASSSASISKNMASS